LKHFYDTGDDELPDSPVHAKPSTRISYRNYILQKSESESSTPRRTSANTTPTTDDDPSSSSSPTLVDQPKLKKSQSGPNYYNSFMNSDDSDTETLKPSNRASNPRSVNIKMDCYDELETPVNNNNNNLINNNSGNAVNKGSSSNSSKLSARNVNARSNNHNGNSVISEDKVFLLEQNNEEDCGENQHYLTEEGVMLRRRPKGSTAIKRRSGNRR
jgi:hypothetical protein